MNNFYTFIERSKQVGVRLCRIPTCFTGNRMVVVHPSLSKNTSTSSAEAFWDGGIDRFSPGEKAAKNTILAARAFYYSFSIYIIRKYHFL